jgi:hypothetical protein
MFGAIENRTIALGKIGANEPGYIHTVHDGYVAKNVVWLS